MIRAVSLLLVGSALGATVPLVVVQDDMTKLIPRPVAETYTALSAITTSLGDAANAAAEAVGGKAAEARFVVDAGITEVTAYTAESTWTVHVDGTGAVVAKIEQPPFFLPGAPVTGEMITTESGLMYWDLVVGEGEVPPRKESQVKVHYTGWTVNGKKFDSSHDRNAPATFPLSGVIKGWTEGVGSMHVGGKRKLAIPGGLAYGPSGRPPMIPPNAMLVFDVELLEIVTP